MTGSFVLTFDLELGWGALENGLWRAREHQGVYQQLRLTFPRLLSALRELEIPATWAAVGGMLDRRAEDSLDHLPSPLRELTWRALSEGKESTFDGRVLAEMVQAEALQRLASHSYSHVRFSYPGLSEEMVTADLALATSAFKRIGQTIDTFVFPQNHEGYYASLRRSGIIKARGDEYQSKVPNRMGRAWHNTVMPPPLSSACQRDGVLLESGSLFFNARTSGRLALLRIQVLRGLSVARRKAGTLHVYTHPFNLAESPKVFESFCDLLRLVVKERDRGHLTVDRF